MAKDKKLFVGQKAIIEKDGKILLLFKNGVFTIPGGKIQMSEVDLKKSLQREVREETSLEIGVGDPFYTFIFQSAMGKEKEIFAIIHRCKYKSGDVQLNHEHDSFRWFDKNTYTQLKEDSQFYSALEKYFEGM